MRHFLLLTLFLCFSPFAAQASMTLPMNEADYLKAAGAEFDAADANHNSALDKEEAIKAFSNKDMMVFSPATFEACSKAGRDLAQGGMAEAHGKEHAFKPLARKDYIEARQGLFSAMDSNQDKTVTEAEAKAFDAQMAQMCAAAPALMEKARAFQDGGAHPGTTEGMNVEAMRARAMKQMKSIQNMKGLPPEVRRQLEQQDMGGE